MDFDKSLIATLNTLKKNNKNPFQDGGKRIKETFLSEAEKPKPLITLITIVKNSEEHLQETFSSIFNQSNTNYEYIVIDGNSSDRSLDIIKQNEDNIDYWVSEKDNGIYDAFNKGLLLAKGDLIGFVNSDDILMPDALKILAKYYNNNPEKDFFFGAVKKHWAVLYGYRPWKIYWSWGFYSSHSTGFYVKKEVAKINGFYNLKYKYSSDYDYFFRLIVKNKFRGIGTKKNELFGVFRRGGFSSKIKFFDHFMEEIRIRLDNKQNRILVLIIFIYKYIKNFNKIN
tara:strand:+ start:856 stop:1707 length:852 start_codon:yes stop_codon:yes gene_type:complete